MENRKMILYEQDAMKYGVEEALMLANLRFWCGKNAANEKNVFECSDGNSRAWTYNSASAWKKLFPFWSEQKIRRILVKLVEQGAIEKGNFNKNAYDRTLWYTVMDEESIVCGETIHSSGMNNGLGESDRPIPYSKPDPKPDHKSTPQKVTHPELEVPIGRKRYQTLTASYGKDVVDQAIQERMDWEATKGKPAARDYAAAAANWLKNKEKFDPTSPADELNPYIPGEFDN